MDKLFDKNINFVANENVSKSELEIELDKYFNHKFILTESDKKEIEIYGPLFFFKQFHSIYPKQTPIAKSFLAIMATSVPCESLFSQTGIIANELRNILNPFLLEELTLLKENVHFK